MTSVVLIIPTEYKEVANDISIAQGYDIEPGYTYSVPLSANGKDPVTHYGCRADVTKGFVLLLSLVKGETPPEGTSQELIAQAKYVATKWPDTIKSLIVDIRETSDPYQHWMDVIKVNNLQRIEVGLGHNA